jgi:hypothetical protein
LGLGGFLMGAGFDSRKCEKWHLEGFGGVISREIHEKHVIHNERDADFDINNVY